MGLFGGLFGGTKVSQQAANNTTVEVGVSVENVVDMTGIEKVLEWLGLVQQESTEANTVAAAKNATDLITALKESQALQQEQQKALIEKAVPWGKALIAAAILFLIVKTFNWKF